jgi:hypothetical protein
VQTAAAAAVTAAVADGSSGISDWGVCKGSLTPTELAEISRDVAARIIQMHWQLHRRAQQQQQQQPTESTTRAVEVHGAQLEADTLQQLQQQHLCAPEPSQPEGGSSLMAPASQLERAPADAQEGADVLQLGQASCDAWAAGCHTEPSASSSSSKLSPGNSTASIQLAEVEVASAAAAAAPDSSLAAESSCGAAAGASQQSISPEHSIIQAHSHAARPAAALDRLKVAAGSRNALRLQHLKAAAAPPAPSQHQPDDAVAARECNLPLPQQQQQQSEQEEEPEAALETASNHKAPCMPYTECDTQPHDAAATAVSCNSSANQQRPVSATAAAPAASPADKLGGILAFLDAVEAAGAEQELSSLALPAAVSCRPMSAQQPAAFRQQALLWDGPVLKQDSSLQQAHLPHSILPAVTWSQQQHCGGEHSSVLAASEASAAASVAFGATAGATPR